MARGFHVKRKNNKGKLVERVYELHGNELILLLNPNVKIPVSSGNSPVQTLRKEEQRVWSNLTKPIIREFVSLSGTYIPSIARPRDLSDKSMYNPAAKPENELAKMVWREHQTLIQDLERCFDVTSPHKSNFNAFGTQYEKIIYFSCTSIEALFIKVLKDNSIIRKNYDMRNFVKLNNAMKLNDYSLRLTAYPWIKSIKPFRGRDSSKPSRSLGWFNAYNSLKHDKRGSQKLACLRNALYATAAHYILGFSIFSGQFFPGFFAEHYFFQFEAQPRWRIDERYFPAPDGSGWQPRTITI